MKEDNTVKIWVMSFLIGLAILFSIAHVSSLDNLGTFKQEQTIRLTQVCADATYINISSISYPNSTVIFSNIEMISSGSGEYYYDLHSNYTSLLGRYDVRGISDGCEKTFATYFEITGTGNPEPDGLITFLFIIAFLFVIGSMSYLFINNLGHFAQLDYDLNDLIKNVSVYFVLLGLYFLHSQYLGNNLMENIFVWLIWIGGFTHVAISFLAFIFSYLNKVMSQKVKAMEY